ncbi:MAG: twin-arginine translocase TatA/TatE family subunit [Deltaproteobacteria bacterium]|nr:twin-arginine translocase TatA/TatE family subunit [Deltaproteobacteria bacterium]
MFGLSFWEIALIFIVALVVLGPKRLPDAARVLGKGLRSLRRASTDIRSVIEEPLREVQEPLQEMRDELYSAVNTFSEDVAQSVRDVGAEEHEIADSPRIASTTPFDAPEGQDDEGQDDEGQDDEGQDDEGQDDEGQDDEGGEAHTESGPSLLAAGPEPELQAGVRSATEIQASASSKHKEPS